MTFNQWTNHLHSLLGAAQLLTHPFPHLSVHLQSCQCPIHVPPVSTMSTLHPFPNHWKQSCQHSTCLYTVKAVSTPPISHPSVHSQSCQHHTHFLTICTQSCQHPTCLYTVKAGNTPPLFNLSVHSQSCQRPTFFNLSVHSQSCQHPTQFHLAQQYSCCVPLYISIGWVKYTPSNDATVTVNISIAAWRNLGVQNQ